MVINGKIVPFESCILSNNTTTADFVWVAYDSSRARLPVAIAATADDLAEIMGVTRNAVESTWCSYRRGRLKTTKYAKVYIGGSDDE